jgi:hypothetical protein
LTGYIKYVEPVPQALYNDARNDIKKEFNAMITSSQHAVDRGELEKAAAIRLFLEGSAAFEKHFEDVDFRAYCSDLLEKHKRAADHFSDEIDDLLDKHKFSDVRNKLRNLISQSSQESATPVDPNNRLMFESIEEKISEWFRKWLCRIMDETGFQLSEPELTTTMEAHLRLVGGAMVVLEVITLTCSPLKLLAYLYSIFDEQFKRLKEKLLKTLSRHRFQQASQLYLQLKRLKNLDLTLQPHLDKLESGSSLFAPRIDDIVANTIEPIRDCAHAACLKYLGSTENLSDNGNWTSISVESNGLTELLFNTRTAATSSDELMDDLVDFCAVQRDLVVIITDFLTMLLLKVHEVIVAADGDFNTVEELLENADNVLGTLCAHTDESNGIKKLKQRLQALKARQSNDVSCVVFSPSCIRRSTTKLKSLMEADYISYSTLLDAICSAFVRCLGSMKASMKSGERLDQNEAKQVFQFIDAMIMFKYDILPVRAPHDDYMAECEICIQLFRSFVINHVGTACQAIKDELNVMYVKEFLTEMKNSCVVTLQHAQGDLAKFLTDAAIMCDKCVHEADAVIASIDRDASRLKEYDLFARVDTNDMIKKLERLSKQKSRTSQRSFTSFGFEAAGGSSEDNFDQVKASMSNNLAGVVDVLPELLEYNKYDVVRNAFENVKALVTFEPLAVQAQDAAREMISQVQSAHSRISDTFGEAVRTRDFKQMNKAVATATASSITPS